MLFKKSQNTDFLENKNFLIHSIEFFYHHDLSRTKRHLFRNKSAEYKRMKIFKKIFIILIAFNCTFSLEQNCILDQAYCMCDSIQDHL